MNRRGFTLIELLVVAILMALVGTAMARMLISDSRFVARQDAMMDARQASRAALNTVSVELRMVSDSGLLAATPKSITVRVPYAFGMACQSPAAGTIIASLMPPDSLTYALSTPYGLAWSTTMSQYNVFVNGGIAVASSGNTANCTADSIRVVPRGKLVSISGIPTAPVSKVPPSSTLFYLYQRVTYNFAPSVQLPGRTGLWRQVTGAAVEELVTPFDTSSSFGFLTGSNLAVSTNPPADLNTVRGIQLRLVGQSQRTPAGSSLPIRFNLQTKIAFLNRIN